MRCRKCGAPLEDGELFCGNCGAKAETLRFCDQCGRLLGENEDFCGYCASLTGNAAEENVETPLIEQSGVDDFTVGGASDYVFCGNCGAQTERGSSFCMKCGAQLGTDGTPVMQSRAVRPKGPEKRDKTFTAGIIIIGILILAVLGGAVWIWFNMMSGDLGDAGNMPAPEATQSVVQTTLMPVQTPAITPVPAPVNEYLFKSDEEIITWEYLSAKSQEEVRLLLNEIYARHGYIFSSPEYITYFTSKPWYEEKYHLAEDAEREFNETERANKEIIVNYEKSRGWR